MTDKWNGKEMGKGSDYYWIVVCLLTSWATETTKCCPVRKTQKTPLRLCGYYQQLLESKAGFSALINLSG